MNKITFLKALGATGTVLSSVAGIASYNSIIPQAWLPVVTVAGVACINLHKIVDTLGDWLDDGKLNESFKS